MKKKTKEPGKKSIKKMKKVQKKRTHELEKKRSLLGFQIVRKKPRKISTYRKERSIKEEARLNKVGFELSKKFTYSQLVSAIDGRGGFEVHGFMEKTYLDYDFLIEKMVLDRACFYAKRDYTPEIINFIREIDIVDCERSVIETSKEIHFENYPEFPFNKLIIYSKGPFDDAINWLDDYPWELDGYDTFVTLGPANLGLLGWATWNIPIVLILHAPGKNKAFFDAVISAKDLKNEKTEQLKNFIYQYRTYVNVMEEKIDEIQLESLQYQKLYSDLKRTIMSSSPISTAEEFNSFERNQRKKMPKFSKKTILWSIVFMIIVVMLFVIIFQMMIPAFIGTVNSTIPDPDLSKIILGKI